MSKNSKSIKQMTEKHKYEYDISPNTAPERVVHMVGSDKRILELGSGPGAITQILTANNCRVTALEIDSTAIEIVRPYCENIYQCDLNYQAWPNILPDIGQFETIVAADVLEHLYDPRACLDQLHGFLAKNGSLVVSLPHVGHAAVMACLFNSDFDYHSCGLLDETHVRFFGLTNIQTLFEAAGFKIIEVDFVVANPAKTELSEQWARVPKRSQKNFLSGKFSHVYQVVLRAVPSESSGQALKLTALPIPGLERLSITNHVRNNSIGGYFASFIPSATREKITKAFKKFGL